VTNLRIAILEEAQISFAVTRLWEQANVKGIITVEGYAMSHPIQSMLILPLISVRHFHANEST
jgi:hypothetical protein